MRYMIRATRDVVRQAAAAKGRLLYSTTQTCRGWPQEIRYSHGSTDHTTLCVMHESLVCCRLKAQAMKLNTHRHIMLCLITQAVAAAADSLLCNEQV